MLIVRHNWNSLRINHHWNVLLVLELRLLVGHILHLGMTSCLILDRIWPQRDHGWVAGVRIPPQEIWVNLPDPHLIGRELLRVVRRVYWLRSHPVLGHGVGNLLV